MNKKRNRIIGNCYYCNRELTSSMLKAGKAVAMGIDLYRCISNKCERKSIKMALEKLNKVKVRGVWKINPKTRVKKRKKKRRRDRSKTKKELRNKEDL